MPTDSPDGLKTPPEELVALPPAAASAASRADSPPGLKPPPEELVAKFYQEKEDRASAEKVQKEELCTKVLGCPSQRPNVNPRQPKQQGVLLPAAASTAASTAVQLASASQRPSKAHQPQPKQQRVMLPAAASAASAADEPGSPANSPRSNRPPAVVSPPSHQPTAKAEKKKKRHQAMLHSLANNGTDLFASLLAAKSSGWAADFETDPEFVMIYTHTTVEAHDSERAMKPDPVASMLDLSCPPENELLGIPDPSGNGDDRNISPRSNSVTFSLPTSFPTGKKKKPEEHQKTEMRHNSAKSEVKRKLFHQCNDSCKKKALPCDKQYPSSSSDDTDDDDAKDDHAGGGGGGGGGEVPLFNGEDSEEQLVEEPPPLVKRSSLHREDDEDDSMEEEDEDDEMEEEVDDGSEDEDGTEDDEMKEEKEAEDASSSNSSFICHDESLSTGEDASYAPSSPSSNGTDLDSTYTDVAETVDELLEDQKEDERVTRKTPRSKSENGVARYSPSDEEALLSDDYPEEQHGQVGEDGMRQLTIPELIDRHEVRASHARPSNARPAARTYQDAHPSDGSPPSAAASDAVAARGRKPDPPPTSHGQAAAVRMYARKKKDVKAAKDYSATSVKVMREVEVIDLTGAPARPRGARRQEVDFVDLTLDDSSDEEESDSGDSSTADSESSGSSRGARRQEVDFVDLTLDDSSDEEESDSGDSSTADSESSGSSGGDSSSTSQDGEDEH